MASARRVIAGGVIATAALGTAVVGILSYQASAGQPQLSDRYRLVTAGPGTVTTSLSLSGTVHHVDQVSVSFPTVGTVVQVHVKPGDQVAAGAPLASIDTTPLQEAVLEAEAGYQQAQLKLQMDQKIYDAKDGSAPVGAGGGTALGGTPAGAAPGQPGSGSGGAPAAPGGAPGSAGPGRPAGTGPGTPDAQAAARAAAALAALQQTVSAVQAEVPVFAQVCLAPLQTMTPGPATQTVTAT
ncbi:MAG: biotin/lipoyl-binding protein, partial [Actinomycetia bacterium]|nr:biotin/lipoyl-binding protein [Actinomycetes bacterium]